MLGERTGYDNGQLVKSGPGRPGYGGPHETEKAGRDYSEAVGRGEGEQHMQQALQRFAQLPTRSSVTAPHEKNIPIGVNEFNNLIKPGLMNYRKKYRNILRKHPTSEFDKWQRLEPSLITEEEGQILEPYGPQIWEDMAKEDPAKFFELKRGKKTDSPGVAPKVGSWDDPDVDRPRQYAWVKDGGKVGFQGGGLAGMLGEPTYADGGRTGFKKGTKFDPTKRTFLKGLATLATIPFIGKYFKWAKPLAKSSKVLTSVPIKAGVDGMPAWFKPFVNQIIKKGDDVTKTHAYQDMQVVHKTTLPESKTEVILTQNIDTGDVVVDIGSGKHGFAAGHHGQPVRLEYRAAEDIMTGPDADDLWKIGERDPHVKTKSRKELKTNKKPEEFWVEEAEFTGGHPENVKFEESAFEKFGEHGSDFSEVEKFATGKVKKAKPLKKREITEYEGEKAQADAERYWEEHGDYASGGRVPFKKGKTEWLQLLDKDWDEDDPDHWELIKKLLLAGEIGAAEGGRVPMFAGGPVWKAWKAFISGFFLKTSNEMRQGKGIWKDLTPEQMWKQHDNLTKKSVEWRLNNYKKLPGGMKEYFGMNDIQLVNAFKKAQAKVKAQKYADEMDAEMWDAGRDAVDSLTGKKEVLKRVKMGDKAAIKEKIKRDERAMIKQKYQGKIDDKLLNQILIDDNPARIAEVTATIDEALIMQHKGMGPETIMQTFKDAWKRKKQASGGLAGMLGE